MAAAAAALPFVPSVHPCFPKKIPNCVRIKLKIGNNLKAQRVSYLAACAKSSKPSSSRIITGAYVSGPAFDAIVSESDQPKIDASETAVLQPIDVISWGLLWKLISRHKLRVFLSFLTLLGCTTCTLAMPIFSGMLLELYHWVQPSFLFYVMVRNAIYMITVIDSNDIGTLAIASIL